MEELVLLSKQGNTDSFTELIQLIKNDLYKVAQARLNNIEDINDAIQETMIIAYKNIKKLNHPKYFKTWIIKILINECNKIYKNNNRSILLFKKAKEKYDKDDNLMDLQRVENKLKLEEILESLSYEEKICIILFYNSNYTLLEIADILNMNINTVKSKITRAKQKIKKEYKEGAANERTKK